MNRLRHLGSIDDLSTEEILALLDRAEQLRQGATGEWRPGRVLTLAFFESSTRTRVGFASAGARLGFVPIDLNAPRHSAGMSAQESLSDTIRVVSAYSDLLVLRHPSRSAWETAMEVAQCPMINGGCGAGEHPSQALIDLFAIRRAFGRLSGLRVGIVGDIAGSRAVHSFVRGLQRFGQAELRLMGPESRLGDARFAGASYGTALDLEGLDVVYMAGLPAGVGEGALDAGVRGAYALTAARIGRLPPGAIVLSPLPRIDEIDKEIDVDSSAQYFENSDDAAFIRTSLMERGFDLEGREP